MLFKRNFLICFVFLLMNPLSFAAGTSADTAAEENRNAANVNTVGGETAENSNAVADVPTVRRLNIEIRDLRIQVNESLAKLRQCQSSNPERWSQIEENCNHRNEEACRSRKFSELCGVNTARLKRQQDELKEMEERRNGLNAGLTDSQRRSARQEVTIKKDSMDTLKLAGVVATAGLAYLTEEMCTVTRPTACKSDPSGAACYWAWTKCIGLGILTTHAGVQTYEMFKKGNEIERFSRAIGDGNDAGAGCDPNFENCSTGGGPTAQNPPTPPPKKPGNPDDRNSQLVADVIADAVENAGSEPPSPEELGEKILDAVAGEKGWTDKMTASLGGGGFSYDKLSPQQKKYVDDLGQSLGANLNVAEEEEDEEEDSLATAGGAGPAPKMSSFSGPPSVAKSAGGSGNKAPAPKKNNMSDIHKMLMESFRNPGKEVEEDFSEQFVQVGADNVGVKDDNIFIMVHRRHRSLAGDKRFIVNPF